MALHAQAAEFLRLWQGTGALPKLEIQWNSRLRTTAGRALLQSQQLQLNPHLLGGKPENQAEVLAHELAHLLVFARHGAKARHHGPEWAALMQQAGFQPRARHELPVQGLRRRAFYYLHLCGHCQARWIQRRSRGARCLACGRKRLRVYRAPRSAEGLQALQGFPHASVNKC